MLIARVACRLGNTPAVCRASYIDQEVLLAGEEGRCILARAVVMEERTTELDADEASVLAFLRRGLRAATRKAA